MKSDQKQALQSSLLAAKQLALELVSQADGAGSRRALAFGSLLLVVDGEVLVAGAAATSVVVVLVLAGTDDIFGNVVLVLAGGGGKTHVGDVTGACSGHNVSDCLE